MVRLDYSQGCLKLKKEEQCRATNWGLIRVIDKRYDFAILGLFKSRDGRVQPTGHGRVLSTKSNSARSLPQMVGTGPTLGSRTKNSKTPFFFYPYDDPMGNNRKIRLFELVRDAGPTRVARCDLTYFNLSSSRFSHSQFLVIFFSSSSAASTASLSLLLPFLAAACLSAALLRPFSFCVAASVFDCWLLAIVT
ncbi:hypothetical protein M9H77_08928 [Catharanthus roseus]|uniref:Uncharacterized protein n=1 Tax=Catharanthus roseus TaxID=4058 RepID=A0ACC0BZ46_CATRO|nr:hypothetical protein M9H77_08928 [Catharanthus roseus]